ncbi:MAG: hypothetical protein HY520_01670 [Candidatus Aenigmarchaeota archaeon]|nr:hypothetical protein [Candidatus Aenigmarchaeota archaeon]
MARYFPGTVIGAGRTLEGKPFALYLLTDLAAADRPWHLVPAPADRRVRAYHAGTGEAYAALAWDGGHLVASNGSHTDRQPDGRPGGLLDWKDHISAVLLEWGDVPGQLLHPRIGLRLGAEPHKDAREAPRQGDAGPERTYVAHFGITSPSYTRSPFMQLEEGEAYTGATFSGRSDRLRTPALEAWLHQQPMDGRTADELLEEQAALAHPDFFLGAAAALYDGSWKVAVRNRSGAREHG